MSTSESIDELGRFELDGAQVWGQVNLRPDAVPRAVLGLDVGDPWSRPARSSDGARMDLLVGTLMSNDSVAFGEVHLSEFFSGRVDVGAAWAVSGVDIADQAEHGWRGVQLQLSGLDRILASPITNTQFPLGQGADPRRYTVETEQVALRTMADGVTVTARHRPVMSIGKPPRFAIEAVAEIVLESEAPLPIREWLDRWIDPLSAIVLLLTGARERIGPVALFGDLPVLAGGPSARLWGSRIHQAALPREQALERWREPLAMLEASPGLAHMVSMWRNAGLPESIAQLFRAGLDTGLPIFPRFAALIQALEALDTRLHRSDEEATATAYRERRDRARTATRNLDEAVLAAEHRQFICDELPRRPPQDLSRRLRRSIASVALPEVAEEWERRIEPLRLALPWSQGQQRDLGAVLAKARNHLAHGESLESGPVAAAIPVADAVLRGQLLRRLGFDDGQIRTALSRANRG